MLGRGSRKDVFAGIARNSGAAWRAPRIAAALVVLAALASAQKVGRTYHEDARNGFRFKYPYEWEVTPVQPQFAALGMQAKLDGKPLSVQVEGGVTQIRPDVAVFAFVEREVPSDEEAGEDRTKARLARRDVADVIVGLVRGLDEFEKAQPRDEEERKVKGVPARRRTWEATNGFYPILLDTWTFRLDDRDICLMFRIPAQYEDDYIKVFERSARTFEEIEREQHVALTEGADYAELLAYHTQEAERIPGWRVLPTPSQKFIVKTSSDDDRFLDEVIDRLEKSRAIFEEDFPPDRPMEAVSVVRVCQDATEFRSYGNVSRGVAGFFSPTTKELVLYDAVEIDRNSTFATMTHEAFHQYCHYLFGESEAHRWFDEGHGDYYGGMKFTPRRAEITARMPAGLNRLDHVRELVRTEEYAPIQDHIRFSHREWQTQGPKNVSCYSQSWSIIYMLRQGTLGKVPRKVWKDEYAEIIPDYMRALNEGFAKAFAELREEALAEAQEAGEEPPTEEELRFDSRDLDPKRKKEIWEEAIQASWGKIDLAEFQENWALYVKKYLKD